MCTPATSMSSLLDSKAKIHLRDMVQRVTESQPRLTEISQGALVLSLRPHSLDTKALFLVSLFPFKSCLSWLPMETF